MVILQGRSVEMLARLMAAEREARRERPFTPPPQTGINAPSTT